MATNEAQRHRSAIIGNPENFWSYSSKTGFDLTHPDKPNATPSDEHRVGITTTTTPFTLDTTKTALVIVDMQNFFLSPAFGRSKEGAGHVALHQLLEHAIPAARRAGIRIIWLNWGLTSEEVEAMPPAIKRAFGFEAVLDDGNRTLDPFTEKPDGFGVDKQGSPRPQGGDTLLENGKDGRIYKGLGRPCGIVTDPSTGKQIDAGKLLMRDQWNAALYSPLDRIYQEGTQLTTWPDVWIHKNRMSGLWGAKTACEEYLENEGITTLLFTGVNTDQCVSGTLTDAFSKGYDCILLSDGCGTTSPEYAQQCIEFNSARTWGFVATCKALANGVAGMVG